MVVWGQTSAAGHAWPGARQVLRIACADLHENRIVATWLQRINRQIDETVVEGRRLSTGSAVAKKEKRRWWLWLLRKCAVAWSTQYSMGVEVAVVGRQRSFERSSSRQARNASGKLRAGSGREGT